LIYLSLFWLFVYGLSKATVGRNGLDVGVGWVRFKTNRLNEFGVHLRARWLRTAYTIGCIVAVFGCLGSFLLLGFVSWQQGKILFETHGYGGEAAANVVKRSTTDGLSLVEPQAKLVLLIPGYTMPWYLAPNFALAILIASLVHELLGHGLASAMYVYVA